jgi:hypothetical protein
VIKNFLIFILITISGASLLMWKLHQNRADLNQRAIECHAFVNEGIDLTGKGKNNCTSPELIPNR